MNGRLWAMRVFGTYGPRIRDEIWRMVQEEHLASANAQDACGHQSQSVYGQFYAGISERFAEFGRLPGAVLARPGRAPYQVPLVNGVALYPWRHSGRPEDGIGSRRFGTSEARLAVANLPPQPVQGMLDLGLPDPGLTEEEQRFAEIAASVMNDPVVTSGKLVVVAICSSARGLHAVEWGEVSLQLDEHLDWTGFHESLMGAMGSPSDEPEPS
ncbi:hypothetical protein ACWCW7_34810 [Nocardia tengchongensis]|uniref:hypothetical protein n=1 Tax=Nocardia tengchongensis TaxID=2055889 RepID=UPI0036741411